MVSIDSSTANNMDPSITSAISLLIEKAINTALRYDPGTRKKLSSLEDCTLEIHCSSPEFRLYFDIDGEYVRTTHYREQPCVICISGAFVDFASAVQSEHPNLADSNIKISGKLNLLNQLQSIFETLEIDWEQALCEIIGVIPGNLFAQSLRHCGHWTQQQGQFVKNNLADYLSEELKVVPSVSELDDFYHDVDELNASVQRADAKLKRLLIKRSST